MNKPDDVKTTAKIVVVTEDMDEHELKVWLAERLKGVKIESLEVSRDEHTYEDVKSLARHS